MVGAEGADGTTGEESGKWSGQKVTLNNRAESAEGNTVRGKWKMARAKSNTE
jgi:hypothetical protein